MWQDYTPNEWNERTKGFKRLKACMGLDGLTRLYHELCQQAEAYGHLDWVAESYIPIAEYHIDGIDEAADNEEKDNLQNLIAASCYDLSTACHAYKEASGWKLG